MEDEKLKKIDINCFNCRGLRNREKRLNIFSWLKRNHNGIVLLQETHSTILDEKKWESELDGVIYYSHGEYNAKGVAILIPNGLDITFEYINGIKDKEGRFLMINCKLEDNHIVLINIYCPTKDNVSAQNLFLENIKSKIEEYSNINMIIGGDLNTYLDVKLDKKGGRKEEQSTYSNNIISLCEEYSLVDIWRTRNPDKMEFTRREKCKGGLVQSRLDYWLISTSLTYQTVSSFIKPVNSSDHSILTLSIELIQSKQRGKIYWKFNNDLLMDKEYTQKIKSIIEYVKNEVNIENKNTLWEYLKCQIRTDTIQYSINKAKKARELEKRLIERIEILEKNLDGNETTYVEYLQCKLEWENIVKRKTQGIILSSKAKWVEEGEQNTKYFSNLEKRNYKPQGYNK